MDLGLYTFGDLHPDPVTGVTVSPQRRMTELLERIELADQVGLDYAGLGEHHRREYLVSSPATVIAAAVARTSRIRVGSAAALLSTSDPVRLVQAFATADLVAPGRVELMVGRGAFLDAHALFGLAHADYSAAFEENLDLLLTLLDRAPVTWSGRFRPALREAWVTPRPTAADDGDRPLHVGLASGGDPASSVRAGALGLPITYAIIGGRVSSFSPVVELYRATWREAGHAGPPRVSVATWGLVGDSGEQTRETFFPHWWENVARLAMDRDTVPPDRPTYEAATSPDGACLVGDPEQVAERLVAAHRALGHDRHLLQLDVAGVPHPTVMRAIELLGTRVAPLVREELGR